jgi:hypothetical protein
MDWGCGNTVGIASDYGLDHRAIGVRSPTEAKGFPLAFVQTS